MRRNCVFSEIKKKGIKFFEFLFWKSKLSVFLLCFFHSFCSIQKKKEIGYYPHREQKIVDFFLIIREEKDYRENIGFHSIAIQLLNHIHFYNLSVVCKWLNYGNYDIQHKSTESYFFCILEIEEKNKDPKPYSRETKWITLQRVCITAQNDERRS